MKNENWHKDELLSRQGEIIIPANFGKLETTLKKGKVYLVEQPDKNCDVFKKKEAFDNLLAEICYKVIAEELGIPTVNIKPAVMIYSDGKNTNEGFLMENIIDNENQLEVPAHKILDKHIQRTSDYHTIEDNMLCLQLEKERLLKNNKVKDVIVDKDIRNQLLQIFFMDYITVLTDRHDANITYIYELKDDCIYINLAKNYDNSFAFDFFTFFENYDIHTIEDQWKYVKDYTFFSFGIKNEENNEDCLEFGFAGKQLAEEIKTNPFMKELYFKARALDFEKIKGKIQNELPQQKIPNKIFDYMQLVMGKMLQSLEKNLTANHYENIKEGM